MSERAQQTIEELIAQNPVMLFMKGNKVFPQCGFSHEVVQRLKQYSVPFQTFNVLADPEVRAQVKLHADWPTIPQLYVKGDFVGGCDIVRELDENGELGNMLAAATAPAT